MQAGLTVVDGGALLVERPVPKRGTFSFFDIEPPRPR